MHASNFSAIHHKRQVALWSETECNEQREKRIYVLLEESTVNAGGRQKRASPIRLLPPTHSPITKNRDRPTIFRKEDMACHAGCPDDCKTSAVLQMPKHVDDLILKKRSRRPSTFRYHRIRCCFKRRFGVFLVSLRYLTLCNLYSKY